MRQRKDEVLGEGIEKTKRKLAMMVRPVKRVFGKVVQGVVHPAHVPFEVESQSTFGCGSGHLGPSGGFLGDHRHCGMFPSNGVSDIPQELYRFKILSTAEEIGDPGTGRAAVVEIEHRSDRIYAQTINVVLLDPEERVGQQKIVNLVAAVVEDQ